MLVAGAVGGRKRGGVRETCLQGVVGADVASSCGVLAGAARCELGEGSDSVIPPRPWLTLSTVLQRAKLLASVCGILGVYNKNKRILSLVVMKLRTPERNVRRQATASVPAESMARIAVAVRIAINGTLRHAAEKIEF